MIERMVEKLRVALELFDAALRMKEMQIRRVAPDASSREVAKQVSDWVTSKDLPQADCFRVSTRWPSNEST